MNIERVLVAVDFGEEATHAARYAVEQFAPDADITLLHVIDPPRRPVFARDRLPPEEKLEAVAREYAARQMHELASFLTSARVRTDIRVGSPHDVVAHVAREIDADLVVVGPHRDRARPSGMLGSTADRIARTCPVPILVAIDPTADAPRNFLVPIDDDDVAIRVAEWTRELARRFDAEVTLLHVWSLAVYSHVSSMALVSKKTEEDAQAEVERELNAAAAHWLEEIAHAGVDRNRLRAEVTWGKPGDVAVEMAARMHADLIVIGRHGTHPVASALLGSTLRSVLHGAQCPVLIVTDE